MIRNRAKMGMVRSGGFLLAVLATLTLALAASTPSYAQQRSPDPAVDSEHPGPEADAKILSPVEYRLGSADRVRVIVYDEPSLSGEFYVSGNGKASLPLIGEIQAAGLTVRAFQDEIQNALKDGYLKDPRVSVEVLTYRPYYIMGEVDKPGQYPFTSDLTVINAVATAGGFTYRANRGRVYIKHIGDQKEHGYPLTSTAPVSPGDTIRIGERLF